MFPMKMPFTDIYRHPDFEPEPGIDTYMTPWCRAHAYLIGVWAGWILFTIQGKTIIMNTVRMDHSDSKLFGRVQPYFFGVVWDYNP